MDDIKKEDELKTVLDLCRELKLRNNIKFVIIWSEKTSEKKCHLQGHGEVLELLDLLGRGSILFADWLQKNSVVTIDFDDKS